MMLAGQVANVRCSVLWQKPQSSTGLTFFLMFQRRHFRPYPPILKALGIALVLRDTMPAPIPHDAARLRHL